MNAANESSTSVRISTAGADTTGPLANPPVASTTTSMRTRSGPPIAGRTPGRSSCQPHRGGAGDPLTGDTTAQYPGHVPIRLVLAEDNVIVREGIRTLLELEDDLELVGT